jgi:hypothetical protein
LPLILLIIYFVFVELASAATLRCMSEAPSPVVDECEALRGNLDQQAVTNMTSKPDVFAF